jgi:hypothetical protein
MFWTLEIPFKTGFTVITNAVTIIAVVPSTLYINNAFN